MTLRLVVCGATLADLQLDYGCSRCETNTKLNCGEASGYGTNNQSLSRQNVCLRHVRMIDLVSYTGLIVFHNSVLLVQSYGRIYVQ
jgi:hypothetical protein